MPKFSNALNVCRVQDTLNIDYNYNVMDLNGDTICKTSLFSATNLIKKTYFCSCIPCSKGVTIIYFACMNKNILCIV